MRGQGHRNVGSRDAAAGLYTRAADGGAVYGGEHRAAHGVSSRPPPALDEGESHPLRSPVCPAPGRHVFASDAVPERPALASRQNAALAVYPRAGRPPESAAGRETTGVQSPGPLAGGY